MAKIDNEKYLVRNPIFEGGKTLTFNTTTALFVPKGMKHGPITWKKFSRPYIQIAMVMGGGKLKNPEPGEGSVRDHILLYANYDEFCRYFWAEIPAVAPSPTAVTTCRGEPLTISPAANIPGTGLSILSLTIIYP
jgi:hypothetical protein